jgi:PAS domain S-box-containing protein
MSENSNFKKRIQSFLGGKQSKLYDSFLTNLEAFPEAYSNSKDTGELIERNKELLCIHTVSQITNSREHPFDTVLELVAKIIAQAFQFPDIAEAQIICCDDVYQTSNFKKTNDLLSAEIPLSYFSAGELNVVYTQKPETDSQKPFLPQEEALIHTLARIIGNAVENRRYEKALIESESKYRRFFQQSGVGILRFSQTGEILEANKAFAQILGFEDAEALVEHSGSVLPFHKNPDDFNKLRETLEARGSFENYTISALTAKGTDIWLEMNAVKLQDKDLYYYEAVVKDITKQVKAKQQLAESEKRYRALLSAANDAIFVADIESGRIIQCNKQAERLLKKTQGEITAMHFSDLHPEDKREEYAEGFRKQAEKAKSVLGLFWVVDSNQNHIPVEISSAVTTSGDKTLSIGIFRDMSERQNNEMQLKAANEEFAVVNERLTEANEELIQSNELLNESEQKFRAIFDNINDAVGLHKIDHGRIGKFIEVNRRACEMFGYDLSEFQKMNPEDMIPEDNREQVATLFQQLLSKGYARAETYNRTKSGKLIPVEINALIFEMGGENFLTAVTRDISRQVQDREIIRKSEERYKLLSSLTFEGIILHHKGILHDANQSFYDIFGYSEDELLGKNIISLLIDKESQELIYENIRKKVAKPYEVTGLKKDGTAIPLELEAYNLKNTPGNFRVAAVRNIAERKQAEKTIRETNKRLKELNRKLEAEKNRAQKYLDVAGVMMLMLDSDGKIALANKRTAQVLGRLEKELIGKNWFENFIPENQKEEIFRVFKKNLNFKTKKLDFYENDIHTAKGEIRRIQWHNVYIKNPEGIVTGLLSSGLDVTEERLAKKRLEESERKFKNIFDYSYVGIALGNPEGMIIEVNEEFARMTAYTKEELCQMHFNDFTHPDDRAKEAQMLEKLMRGEIEYYSIEKRYLNKTGEILWMDATISALRNSENSVELFIGMVMDVSERKQREHLLKKSQKQLKELNATKDKFFSIISHDLKNPFGQLVGFSELIMKSLEKGNYDKIYDFSRVIYDSSHHGMKLLENLLQWSRAQTGRIRFKPVELNLKQVVEATMDSVRSAALKKNIELQNLITEQTVLEADEDMLQTILRNLISNALKYSRPGGDIQIYSIENEGYILISVNDNGIGMKPETADNLFNIAQNVSVKGTANETGTGLGLILCKEFAEKHGGSISVESAYGKGSTFTLELPYRPLSE